MIKVFNIRNYAGLALPSKISIKKILYNFVFLLLFLRTFIQCNRQNTIVCGERSLYSTCCEYLHWRCIVVTGGSSIAKRTAGCVSYLIWLARGDQCLVPVTVCRVCRVCPGRAVQGGPAVVCRAACLHTAASQLCVERCSSRITVTPHNKMKVNKNGQKAGLVNTTGKAGSEVRGDRTGSAGRNARNVSEKTPAVASGVHTPRASQGQTGAKSKSVERSRATTGALAVNKPDTAELKSPKGVKRKTDQKVGSSSVSPAKTDLDLKAKKVKKQVSVSTHNIQFVKNARK